MSHDCHDPVWHPEESAYSDADRWIDVLVGARHWRAELARRWRVPVNVWGMRLAVDGLDDAARLYGLAPVIEGYQRDYAREVWARMRAAYRIGQLVADIGFDPWRFDHPIAD